MSERSTSDPKVTQSSKGLQSELDSSNLVKQKAMDKTQSKRHGLSEHQKPDDALLQIEKLREIIVRPALTEHDEQRKEKLRQDVTQVFTQALYDREHLDASVSASLVPHIQKSVKHAMLSQKKEFTNAMFPLVGGLVRKYVTVLLRDFIEKTNQLIENSLSIRGLKWRFNAWRSGIPFAKYVISQTYVYQIEQVLLIHRDTGTLLNAVNHSREDHEDSVLVSAMLSAINDFVSDSFSKDQTNQEQQLDEIKTDELTLLLIQGPSAMLVAAVNGNISPQGKLYLREAMERLHSQFSAQFENFDGNTEDLAGSTELLETCLVSEFKDKAQGSTKNHPEKQETPIFAITLVFIILLGIAYWWYLHWQTASAVGRLNEVTSIESIVPISIEKQGIHSIHLRYLSSKDAENNGITDFIKEADVPEDWVHLFNYPLLPQQNAVFNEKLTYILSMLPSLSYDNQRASFSGQLSAQEYDQLVVLNNALETTSGRSIDTSQVIITQAEAADELDINMQALEQLSSQISQYQVDFAISSSVVDASQQNKLEMIAQRFNAIRALGDTLGKKSYLLVIGSSDNSGVLSDNIELGKTRADTVAQVLIDMGIDENEILLTGVLPVDVGGRSVNARKTLVTVIHSDAARN
ncbi:hypothetical protein PN836_010660 [Ningiella sp. W23]|uniref:hypothetical protein n=1 Tax=Ningiella sp. W23 TaxID=3023715 RepID=UPI0037567AD8